MILDFLKKFLLKKKSDSFDYKFFQDMHIFKYFSDREIDDISTLFIYKRFKKDEIIFRENFPQVVLYIVQSGKVRLYQNKDDIEIQIAELSEKMMFGEIGLFIDVNRVFSASALEDTVLIAINKTDIISFMKIHHGTAIKLLWNLGEYISSAYLESNIFLKDYEIKKYN